MDLYLLLKLVHVVAACLWLGGVTILALLVLVVDLRRNDAATLGALSLLGLAGPQVFARVAPLTLATGAVLAWMGGWGLAPWLVLSVALAGFNQLYLTRVLFPAGGAVAARRAGGDHAGAAILARRQLRRLGADASIKLAILALMAMKPGLADPLLLVPVAILLGGVALHLRAPSVATAAQPA